MSDWRDVPRGRPADPRRWHLGWIVGSAVIWLVIGAIVFALVRGWP